jgi:hypothetical protein
MANQYERGGDALRSRYPAIQWTAAGQILGVLDLDLGGGATFALRLWVTNRGTVVAPRWQVDADLSQRGTRQVIPIRHYGPDVVDAVGVVLRCLVSSARAEGWPKVAARLAVVEAGPEVAGG